MTETLLALSINSELNFKNHISNIGYKASRKLGALLGRIASHIIYLLKNAGCSVQLLFTNLDVTFLDHE